MGTFVALQRGFELPATVLFAKNGLAYVMAWNKRSEQWKSKFCSEAQGISIAANFVRLGYEAKARTV